MTQKTLNVEIFEDDAGCTQIRLLEPLVFEWKGIKHVIPAGFVSDGASVPRFFWRLVDPPITAATLIPSVKHDFIYRTKKKFMTRAECDKLYYNDLRANGYSWVKSNLTYTGVRIGGSSSWQTEVAA